MQKVRLELEPSRAECDDYDVLWRINSVDSEKFAFLVNDLVYLVNSKRKYDNTSSELVVHGYLYRYRRNRDYIGCSQSWWFRDD